MSYFPNASISIINSPIPAYAGLVGGSDGTDLRAILTTATGQVHTVLDSGTITTITNPVTVAAYNTTVTGSLTSGVSASVVINTENCSSVLIGTGGTWTGTANVEVSLDGTTWNFASCCNIDTGLGTPGSLALTTFISGGGVSGDTFAAPCSGWNYLRVTNDNLEITSGTVNLTLSATQAPANIQAIIGAVSTGAEYAAAFNWSGGNLPNTIELTGGIQTQNTGLGVTNGGTVTPLMLDASNGLCITNTVTEEVTASWNSSLSVNTELDSTVIGYSSTLVSFNQTSTITGGQVSFEACDQIPGVGTRNWYPVSASPVGGGVSATTYTLQANTNAAFLINSSAFAQVRVRLSTAITGTGTVNVGIQSVTSGGASLINTVAVSGTVTANAGSGNFTVVQSTASALNATVVGTGTFAVQAAQSGTWNIGTVTAVTAITNPLPAGTNVIGHVITDSGSTTAVTGTVAVTQSTSPWVVNTTQWASTALGTPQTFGTAPTGVVIGTSSDIYVAGTRARSNQTTTAAGVVDVNIVGSLGATNSVTNGTFMAITDNTTKVGVISGTTALKTDQSSQAGTAITTVPVAFGTGTPSGNAPGVNAGLFVGTTPVRSNQATTATGVVDTNLAGIKGTTVVTAAAGVQQVGIVGNAAATLDSANTAATAPTNAVLTSAMYNGTVPALTTGQAVAAECDTTGSLYSNPEGRKQTYRCGIVAFTPIASGGTAPAVSVTGSATKTVRITRIRLSASSSTGALADISLQKFTALSGGTANSQSANVAKMDSGNAAQTAVINQWSVAATTHTAAGILNAERYELLAAAATVIPGVIEWTFGDKQGQGLVLRGTSEFVGFLMSAVGTSPVADCWIEWTEE